MSNRDKLKELAVYVFFGALTTLLEFAVSEGLEFFLKPRWGGHSYLFSYIVGFSIALVFAFVVNKLFVFKQKSWERRLVLHEAWTFSAARLFSFGLNHALTFVFFDLLWPRSEGWFAPLWLRVPVAAGLFTPEKAFRLLAKWGFIAVLVVLLNYFFSKWVVFKKKEEEPQA